MKKILGAAAVLAAIVATFLLSTSLGSSAQEENPAEPTTTTTTVVENGDPPVRGRFEFEIDPDADLPGPIDEFLTCLEEEGLALPEQSEGGFRFDFGFDDDLPEVLEKCGLPGRPFFGEFREGFPFGDEPGFGLDDGFPDGFPFGGEFPDGFQFGHRFFDGMPDGPPLGGEGFGRFDFHGPIDRDELAACLAELGSFDSVDSVRRKLDECLPPASLGKGFGLFGFDFDLNEPNPTTTTTVAPTTS